jgi:hypothetical protein
MDKMNKPFNTSYSQLELYQSCPEKWFLIYSEGNKVEPSPELIFGSQVHKILAYCLKEGSSPDQAIDALQITFNDYDPNFVMYCIQNALDELVQDCHEIKAIETKITASPMVGVIDLIYLGYDGKIKILDWKTSSGTIQYDAQANDQLTAYAALYYEKYKKLPDYVGYGVIDKKRGGVSLLWAVRSIDDISAYWAKVNDIYDLQWQRKVRYKNPSNCYAYHSQCHFYNRCWDTGVKENQQF